MKKNFLYVALFFVAGLTFSCSSDDDNNNDIPASLAEQLIGKWEFHQEGTIDDGVEWIDDYNHLCATTKDNIEFKSNGQATVSFYDSSCDVDTETAPFSVLNGKLTTIDGEGTAEISGNILKFKIETSPGYGDILIFKKTN